jgi:hypothetical protein
MADVLHHLVFLHGSIINNMYIPVMNDKEGNHEDQLEQIMTPAQRKRAGAGKSDGSLCNTFLGELVL